MLPPRDDTLDWLRRDWYGVERGRSEIAARQTAPVPISDALDNAVRTILPRSVIQLGKIRSVWNDIVGKVNARNTSPCFLRDGILYVEISHPAYRMALDTPRVKKLMLEKLAGHFGDELCTQIKFVPAGRRG